MLRIRQLIANKFLLFLVVGGINTLFGYSIFALLLYLGLHYGIALLLAMCAGILFNFKTTGNIVFNSKDNALIYKFIGVYGITYLFTMGMIKTLSHFLHNTYLNGAMAILTSAVIAYFLNKELVFKASYETN